MDTMQAFAMGQANRHRELMVFDWDKAATYIKTNRVENAEAGLDGDFEWTGGAIFEDGSPSYEYTHLSSTWATPLLIADGVEIECYKMASEVPDWDCDTKWPDSALRILYSEAKE